MPPWFQVAGCAVAPEKFVIQRDLYKDFWVTLPTEKRPFPEPLPEGKQPGFKFRGTKGWMWTPPQYLAEIPCLAAQAYIDGLQHLSERLKQQFPEHYQPEKQTLDSDIQQLKSRFAAKYKSEA